MSDTEYHPRSNIGATNAPNGFDHSADALTHNQTLNEFDVSASRKFLETVFPDDQLFAFQALPPKGTPADSPLRHQLTQLKIGTLDASAGWLTAMTRSGANVYYGLNKIRTGAKSRKAESFSGTMGAVALDLDGAPIHPVELLFPPAHCVVTTSTGRAQLLWRVADLPLRHETDVDQSDIIKRLAVLFDGDKGIFDAARVLRLPGGYNRNYGAPQLVTADYAKGIEPYALRAFLEALERVESIKGIEWAKDASRGLVKAGP
jgi:hypothetical protein